MSPFLVGMRVVCIMPANHFWGKDVCGVPVPQRGEFSPEHGTIYTVRTVECVLNAIWLRLAEIVNRPSGALEPQWAATGFRPLTSREATMDMLRRIGPDTPIADTPEPNPVRRVPVPHSVPISGAEWVRRGW